MSSDYSVVLSNDHRFAGPLQAASTEMLVHITTFPEVNHWIDSESAYEVLTLCGARFRPNWVGIICVEPDFICPICHKRQFN